MRLLSKLYLLLFACLFFSGLFLLSTVYWVHQNFRHATLDIIVFHLVMPLKGADVRYFFGFGILVLTALLVSALFVAAFWKSYRAEKIFGLRSPRFRIAAFLFSIVLLVSSAGAIEKQYKLYDFLFPGELFSTFVEENSFLPAVDSIRLGEDGNNLIIIILESVEATVNDPAVFSPILMPRLQELSRQGIALNGHRQVVGTEFSLSGFFALTLGMPAKSSFNTRDVVDVVLGRVAPDELEYDDFMGDRDLRELSLLGILEEKGHAVSLMRASDARFCSYDVKMAQSTSKCDIWDLVYFLENRDDLTEPQNSWGVNDSYLYARAKEYLEATHGNGPFSMLIQTVDTHQPGMYEPGMERPYGDHRDSFVQADILADDFIRWVLAQPYGDRTTIVVVGDHLTTRDDIGAIDLPPREERSILAFVLNSRVGTQGTPVQRLYATWDLAPTILEAVGAEVPERRFGLGTSLFAPTRNLLERKGIATYNKMIRKRSRLSEERYGW